MAKAGRQDPHVFLGRDSNAGRDTKGLKRMEPGDLVFVFGGLTRPFDRGIRKLVNASP